MATVWKLVICSIFGHKFQFCRWTEITINAPFIDKEKSKEWIESCSRCKREKRCYQVYTVLLDMAKQFELKSFWAKEVLLHED